MKIVFSLVRKAALAAVEAFSIRRNLEPFMRRALRAQPAFLVRGSSRRIMSMRFRPANIRVINRRADRLGRHSRCFPLAREKQRRAAPRLYLTGSAISEPELQRKLHEPGIVDVQDLSERAALIRYVSIHAIELRVIPHVEDIAAEFQLPPLAEVRLLH